MAGNSKGFTLLELLVALAVASIVLLATTTSLFNLSNARERADQLMEQQRALRNSLDLVRRELNSALFGTGNEKFRFQILDRDFYGKPASVLSFTTLAPPLEAAVSDQIQVIWQVEELGEKLRLVRSSREFFRNDDLESVDYPLIEQVEGFLVECYDGSKWIRTWDTELTKGLPRLIRVTISVPQQDGIISFQVLASPRMEPL